MHQLTATEQEQIARATATSCARTSSAPTR